MRPAIVLSLAVVVLSFLIGIYLYPQLPDVMASHWDERGNVNGYMPKVWGVFFVPILSLVILGFFLIIPVIDPLKANIAGFRKYFDQFIFLLMSFMLYIHLLTLAWNIGYTYNMLALLAPAFGALFYFVGVLTEHAKQNWFIGIRTPWTMSSESVWEKTHKLGGKLFKVCGVLALPGALLQEYAIIFVIAPVILVSAYLFVFSYLEFQKEKGEKAARQEPVAPKPEEPKAKKKR